jgi:hypothetical protein
MKYLEDIGFEASRISDSHPPYSAWNRSEWNREEEMPSVFRAAKHWGLSIRRIAENTKEWCQLSRKILEGSIPDYLSPLEAVTPHDVFKVMYWYEVEPKKVSLNIKTGAIISDDTTKGGRKRKIIEASPSEGEQQDRNVMPRTDQYILPHQSIMTMNYGSQIDAIGIQQEDIQGIPFDPPAFFDDSLTAMPQMSIFDGTASTMPERYTFDPLYVNNPITMPQEDIHDLPRIDFSPENFLRVGPAQQQPYSPGNIQAMIIVPAYCATENIGSAPSEPVNNSEAIVTVQTSFTGTPAQAQLFKSMTEMLKGTIRRMLPDSIPENK